MSNACTAFLVGVIISVSEILLLSKTANFLFLTMDYSPWSSKNLMNQNWPKKSMQVGVDVKSFLVGGASLFSEIKLALKFGQIFLLAW